MIYEMLSGINPFKIKNKNKIQRLEMIAKNRVKMLPLFSKEATSILTLLLC